MTTPDDDAAIKRLSPELWQAMRDLDARVTALRTEIDRAGRVLHDHRAGASVGAMPITRTPAGYYVGGPDALSIPTPPPGTPVERYPASARAPLPAWRRWLLRLLRRPIV